MGNSDHIPNSKNSSVFQCLKSEFEHENKNLKNFILLTGEIYSQKPRVVVPTYCFIAHYKQYKKELDVQPNGNVNCVVSVQALL